MDYVTKAFETIERKDFLPSGVRFLAGRGAPVPIGHGQTNSQPSTVAFMLRQLQVRPGQKVLDVGSGSGWTTALLGFLTGRTGLVVGVEIIPELAAAARRNLDKYGMPWARIYQVGQGQLGWPREAPYDRILVSAAGREIPRPLIRQLKAGGTMVIPVNNSIFTLFKGPEGLRREEHRGFVFVPLVQ